MPHLGLGGRHKFRALLLLERALVKADQEALKLLLELTVFVVSLPQDFLILLDPLLLVAKRVVHLGLGLAQRSVPVVDAAGKRIDGAETLEEVFAQIAEVLEEVAALFAGFGRLDLAGDSVDGVDLGLVLLQLLGVHDRVQGLQEMVELGWGAGRDARDLDLLGAIAEVAGTGGCFTSRVHFIDIGLGDDELGEAGRFLFENLARSEPALR